MSLILISEYNQTYQTYRLVICVYILLCVNREDLLVNLGRIKIVFSRPLSGLSRHSYNSILDGPLQTQVQNPLSCRGLVHLGGPAPGFARGGLWLVSLS